MAIGVTFKPTEQSGQMGVGQASKEGGLQQAIQMLSLRYPKVAGAMSPVGNPSMLTGNGAPRLSGFNPNAAIFQALIHAFSQGQGGSGMSQAMQGNPLTQAASVFGQGQASAPNFQYEQPGGQGSAPSKAWGGSDVLNQVNTSNIGARASYGDQLQRNYL